MWARKFPLAITSLDSRRVFLWGNRLTSVRGAICELRAAGCNVCMDDGVTVDE